MRRPHRMARPIGAFCGPGWCLLVSFFVLACGPAEEGGEPRHSDVAGPDWVLQDSVLVVRSDSGLPGIPIGIDLFDDGSFAVGDVLLGTVWEFSSNGEYLGRYGGLGADRGGPTGHMGGLAVVGDTLLFFDSGQGKIHLYNRGEILPVGEYALEGLPSLVLRGDSAGVIFGLHATSSQGGLFEWRRADGVLAKVDELPADFTVYPNLKRFHSIPVVRWADTTVVGFSPLMTLNKGVIGRGWADTITIPAARRRGLRSRLLRRGDATREELLNSSSFLVALGRKDDGFLVAVHFEYLFDPAQPGVIPARVYGTLISPDFRRACLDALLPREFSTQPQVTVDGNDVVLLDKRLLGNGGAVVVVSRWLLSDSGCRWVDLGP